jgi:hypothetical protein
MNGHGQSAAAAAEEQRWQQLYLLDTFSGMPDASLSTMNNSSNHAATDVQIHRLNAQVGYAGKNNELKSKVPFFHLFHFLFFILNVTIWRRAKPGWKPESRSWRKY